MESSINVNENGHGNSENGHAPSAEADAVDAPEISRLIADVQDLLGRMVHVADPEIARLRARVESTLANLRKAASERAGEVRRQAKAAILSGDDYVRERPWQAVGIAAVAGLVVGVLVAKTSSR